MRYLRVFLAVVLLLGIFAINNSLYTADWYYVGKSANEDTFFIDNESLEKTSLQAKLWVRKGSPDGTTIYYLMGMDRDSRTVKVISRIMYGQMVRFLKQEQLIVSGLLLCRIHRWNGFIRYCGKC